MVGMSQFLECIPGIGSVFTAKTLALITMKFVRLVGVLLNKNQINTPKGA